MQLPIRTLQIRVLINKIILYFTPSKQRSDKHSKKHAGLSDNAGLMMVLFRHGFFSLTK